MDGFVKWLTSIRTVKQPFHGYWQTSDYSYWDYLDGLPIRRPLGEMKVKSEITRPTVYESSNRISGCNYYRYFLGGRGQNAEWQ